MKHVGRIYMGIIFVIMYLPLLIMVLFSFNASVSTSSFEGFSLHWYEELFRDAATLTAFKNSLIIAVVSSIISTVIAILLVYLFHLIFDKSKKKESQEK